MTNKDECREAFEAVAVNNEWGNLFIGRRGDGAYDSSHTAMAWTFWQARGEYERTRATIMVDSPASNDGALIVERAAPQSTTTSRDDWERVMKVLEDCHEWVDYTLAVRITKALAICERNLKE